MQNTLISRLGFAMIAVGGLLGILQSQTTIFDAIAKSVVIRLGGALLMIAGAIVVGVVALKQRSASA